MAGAAARRTGVLALASLVALCFFSANDVCADAQVISQYSLNVSRTSTFTLDSVFFPEDDTEVKWRIPSAQLTIMARSSSEEDSSAERDDSSGRNKDDSSGDSDDSSDDKDDSSGSKDDSSEDRRRGSSDEDDDDSKDSDRDDSSDSKDDDDDDGSSEERRRKSSDDDDDDSKDSDRDDSSRSKDDSSDKDDSSEAKDDDDERRRGSSEKDDDDGGDDSSGGSRRRRATSRCDDLGRKPRVSYSVGRDVTDDMKDHAEDFYRQSRRYCEEVRAVLIGDSIIRHLGNDRSCLREIFRPYRDRGLNFGISGMRSDWAVTVVDWLFGNSCLAPQVAYVAIGVNDCIADDDDGRDAADNIIDILKVLKHYSPDTQVVVQEVLPTSFPEPDFEGEEWEDMDLYDCVRELNRKLRDFVDDNRDSCIDIVDLSGVILDNGRFDEDVLADGVHFWSDDDDEEGDMDKYCSAVANAIEDYSDQEVSARGTALDWVDVEPIHYLGLEGSTYYRWRYNEWSTCSGSCGVQRRTAECHRIDLNSTDTAVVHERECQNVFMNPLERICDVDETCLRNITVPFGALIHQPNSRIEDDMPLPFGKNSVSSTEPCPAVSSLSKILLGCTVALVVALVGAITALMLVWRTNASRECYSADNRNDKGFCPVEKASSSEIPAMRLA